MKKWVSAYGLLFMLIIAALMITCSDSNPTTSKPQQSPGLSIFSGDWQGVVYVERVGGCNIEGAATKQYNISMTWEISKDGNIIAIHETLFDSKWIGMIGQSHEFSATKICTFNKGENMAVGTCPAAMVCDTVYFHGNIEEYQDGRYKLEMEAVEDWCPDNDCRFRIKYHLNNKI